jgi:SAM-dependent methyltransferase
MQNGHGLTDNGDNDYMAYVGPPGQYDFMGAAQFCLLFTLGLRANHYLLDFGCGSLRAGRFFITYLDQGHYFGIEPNKWLIEDAIKDQIGEDSIRIKTPQFDYSSNFVTNVFSERFDFILAQAIFSFCGRDIISMALQNFKESLRPNGIIAATFAEGSPDFDGLGHAWVYPSPNYIRYRPSTIKQFAKETGLFIRRIPWYHPRQTWYILTSDKKRLPTKRMLRYLKGAVLFDPDFSESRQ